MATYVSLGVDINPSPATATVRTTATAEQALTTEPLPRLVRTPLPVLTTTGGQQVPTGGEQQTGGQQETSPPPRETPAESGGFNPLWLILAGVALGGIAISATRSTGLQGLGGSGCGCGG